MKILPLPQVVYTCDLCPGVVLSNINAKKRHGKWHKKNDSQVSLLNVNIVLFPIDS